MSFSWYLPTDSLACNSWRMYGLIIFWRHETERSLLFFSRPDSSCLCGDAVCSPSLCRGSYLLSNSAPSVSLLRGGSFFFFKLNYVAHASPYKVRQTQTVKKRKIYILNKCRSVLTPHFLRSLMGTLPPPTPLTFRLVCGRTASAPLGDPALKGLFDCLVYFMTDFVDDAIKALFMPYLQRWRLRVVGLHVVFTFCPLAISSSSHVRVIWARSPLRGGEFMMLLFITKCLLMFEDQRDGRVWKSRPHQKKWVQFQEM